MVLQNKPQIPESAEVLAVTQREHRSTRNEKMVKWSQHLEYEMSELSDTKFSPPPLRSLPPKKYVTFEEQMSKPTEVAPGPRRTPWTSPFVD